MHSEIPISIKNVCSIKLTAKCQINELAISITILAIVNNFESFLLLYRAVCYSSIKLKRRVELKERKMLEILRNYLG